MKKLIKKSLSLLLCVFMLFGSAPLSGFKSINWSGAFEKIAGWLDNLKLSVSASAESTLAPTGQCGDNVFWTFDESTGTLTISGEGDMYNFGSGSSPFYNNTSINSVIINEGVTSIGDDTFIHCVNITSVTLPDSLTCIGFSAFYYCTSLVDITIPRRITIIKYDAFNYVANIFFDQKKANNLKTIYKARAPWGAKTVNGYSKDGLVYNDSSMVQLTACQSCVSNDVIIPNSVTHIGNGAFNYCTGLTSITIPDSVTNIGDNVFGLCTGLAVISVSEKNPKYDSRNNCNAIIETENNILIAGCKNTLLPDDITSIGSYAFYDCTGLASITIPDSVKSIGDYAFCTCTGLTSIAIPDNVTNIGDYVFRGCTGLAMISVSNKNQKYDSRNNCNAIIETENNILMVGCKNTLIPDNITSIDSYAFYNCKGLISVTIPDSVTSIGSFAFDGCTDLTDVTIPDGVTCINSWTFSFCSSLTSIKIPNSVTTIDYGSFHYCTGLTSITILNGVTNIDLSAFNFCSKLTDVYYNGTESQWENLNGKNEILFNTTVHYLKQCGDNVFWTFDESTGTLTISGEGDMYNFGSGSSPFYNNTSINSVIINEGVTSIGSYIFEQCCFLEKIIIADSVTKMRGNSFVGCPLKYVDMGNGFTSIPAPLINKVYLETLIISNKVTYIYEGTFMGYTNLKSVTIPDSVTRIDESAFEECTSLTEITLPCNLDTIERYCFYNCRNLVRVILPDKLHKIERSAFSGCTSLIDISLSDDIRIEERAFYRVANINYQNNGHDSLFLRYPTNYPWGARTVNGYAKDGLVYRNSFMYQLTACQSCVTGDVVIPNSVNTIEIYKYGIDISGDRKNNYVFYDCSGITCLKIPTSVTKISENAFYLVNNVVCSKAWYENIMQGYGSPWGAKAVDAYIEGDLYYYDSSKELLLGCSAEATGTVIIPDTVEEVGENCFLGCNNITSISFSSPVYFADTAVSGCDNLQTVIAPDNTDSFGVVYTKPLNSGISTASSIYSDNISFEYDTGILLCNKSASGEYSVPSEITHICESAFANCRNVTVKIPEEVNLKSIGTKAFFNTANYNNPLNWINNVLIIDHYVIVSKNVFSGIFNLADNIKGIADKAFERCSSLTGFSFGTNSNLRFLGSRAFSGCSSEIKTSIHLPATLKYVGEDLFDSDSETTETLYIDSVLAYVSPDVESFTIKDGTTKIAAGAFSGCTKLTEIVIPDTVRIIEKNTFKGCIGLKSVTLNENITEIGDSAFADCMSLEGINIPAGVEEIGHLAFYGCVGMKSYNVSNNNKNFKSVNGVLMSKDGRRIIQYPAAKTEINNTYTISDRTFVSDLAFYRCLNLKKIKIGDELEYGNRNPFASCTAGFCFGDEYQDYLFGDTDGIVLKSVSASVSGIFKIPENVTEIGSDAFRECTSITGIDFSEAEGIDVIGDYAFYNCTGLTKITIPNTVTKIGKSAFENCLNLQNVIFDNAVDLDENYNLVSIGNYAFCNCPCNTENGSCNYGVLKAENLSIGKNAFKNVFCDSVKLDSNGLIYGLKPGIENLKDFIGINDDDIVVSCIDKKIATGSTISVTNGNEKSNYYDVVIFGDVNGDGWYDGTDAMIVKCIAAGMLTREQVGEAVYTSADCNHDGVIDGKDVELLEQAGVLLSEVDQSKSRKELIETSSAYNEYLALIDQNVENNSDESTEKSWLDILVQAVTRFINYIIRILSILNLR